MANLGMKEDFWRGRKVLVTGHTGFKGSWLTLWLHLLGAEVVGYARLPLEHQKLFDLLQLSGHIDSRVGDVTDFQSLLSVMKECRPSVVFHLAAQPLVKQSYDDPVDTFHTNVLGTAMLMEAVRLTGGVRALVNVTTDKCYENRAWVWGYRENDTLGGYDPYSSSKACAELVTSSYRSSYFNESDYEDHGCAIATARAGNVIGGGDWSADRLVPDVLAAFESGDRVVVRSPSATRPWQHVVEPISGYLKLAEHLVLDGPGYSGAWNFGPADESVKTVLEVVKELSSLYSGGDWVVDNAGQPHEANLLKLDCSKANSRLGWYPKWHVSEALELVVDWHAALKSGVSMYEYSIKSIKSYMND